MYAQNSTEVVHKVTKFFLIEQIEKTLSNLEYLHEETKFPCRVCDFKTSAKLMLKTHKESVHEVTQFFVRYLTEQIKKT